MKYIYNIALILILNSISGIHAMETEEKTEESHYDHYTSQELIKELNKTNRLIETTRYKIFNENSETRATNNLLDLHNQLTALKTKVQLLQTLIPIRKNKEQLYDTWLSLHTIRSKKYPTPFERSTIDSITSSLEDIKNAMPAGQADQLIKQWQEEAAKLK